MHCLLHGGHGAGAWVNLFLQAGDGAVCDAAGDDQAKIAQIGGDVPGKSVGGDGLRDVDADGCDFFLGDAAAGECPYSGLAGDALGQHAILGAGADQGFFQPADIFDGAEVGTFLAGKFSAQIEDWIADDLARTVIGDVAAAIDFVDLDAAAG